MLRYVSGTIKHTVKRSVYACQVSLSLLPSSALPIAWGAGSQRGSQRMLLRRTWPAWRAVAALARSDERRK